MDTICWAFVAILGIIGLALTVGMWTVFMAAGKADERSGTK